MDPFPYKIYYTNYNAGPVEFVTETGSREGAEQILLGKVLKWAGIVDESLVDKIVDRYAEHIIKGPDDSYGDAFDKELALVRVAAVGPVADVDPE